MLPVLALVFSILSLVGVIAACVLALNVTKQVAELTKIMGDVQKNMNGITKTLENHSGRIDTLEKASARPIQQAGPMALVSTFAPGLTGSKWEPVIKLAFSLVGMYFGKKIGRK